MKKIVSLLLVVATLVVSAFAVTSCGKSGDDLKFGKEFTPLGSQMDVLLRLNAGSIDVGVMDSVMAGYYMSQDTTYSNSLMVVEDLVLTTEQYGIAARKGSGFAKCISAVLVQLAKQGVVDTIAEKYGLKSEICIDKNAVIEEPTAAEMEDVNAILDEGKFIVGYTLFAPIAYEKDGKLIGFDIELAEAVADVLELDVEFIKIDWNAKEALLEAGSIDCIWNGMTITEERLANMAITIPYMNNKQVAVIRKADADAYKATADMADAIIGAEDGSAGMSCVVKEDAE